MQKTRNLTHTCKYQLPFNTEAEVYQCPHKLDEEDYGESLCIFHVPKELNRHISRRDNQAGLERIKERFKKSFFSFLQEAEKESAVLVVDCRGFQFPSLEFARSFSKDIDFSCSVFYGTTDFSAYSLGEISDGFPNYKQSSDSYGILFHGKAKFPRTIFKANANFAFVVFRNTIEFFDAHFDGDVSFSHSRFASTFLDFVTFQKPVSFNNAVFNNSTSFNGSTFNEVTTFKQATFKSTANFFVTTFKAPTDFNQCEFAEVTFFPTEFNELTEFRFTKFCGRTIFTQSSFSGNTFFEGKTTVDNLDELPATRFEFMALNIKKDANVFLERLNLSKATFRDTNLELITFRDVVWHHSPSNFVSPFRRRCLWDEFEQLSGVADRDYEKIAENYRQLVLNYEEKRDYDSAEEFHVGEMEMRRKTKLNYLFHYTKLKPLKWCGEWLNAYSLYRLLNNYGTSYWQGLIVLILFLLIFSALFLFAGFRAYSGPSWAVIPAHRGQ